MTAGKKLTEAKKAEIIKMQKSGCTTAQIKERFDISSTTVLSVLHSVGIVTPVGVRPILKKGYKW